MILLECGAAAIRDGHPGIVAEKREEIQAAAYDPDSLRAYQPDVPARELLTSPTRKRVNCGNPPRAGLAVESLSILRLQNIRDSAFETCLIVDPATTAPFRPESMAPWACLSQPARTPSLELVTHRFGPISCCSHNDVNVVRPDTYRMKRPATDLTMPPDRRFNNFPIRLREREFRFLHPR
jgi:hypothetical protein